MALIDIEKIRQYFSTQPVSKAWLFGSFARGKETLDSDIDLLVEFEPNKKIGMSNFKILADLETLFRRKVDMVEVGMLDARVAPFVENDKVLIYERAR